MLDHTDAVDPSGRNYLDYEDPFDPTRSVCACESRVMISSTKDV